MMSNYTVDYSEQRASWCIFKNDKNGLTREFIHGGYNSKSEAELHLPLVEKKRFKS